MAKKQDEKTNNMTKYSFYIDANTYDEFKIICIKNKKKVNKLLIEFMENYIKKESKKLEKSKNILEKKEENTDDEISGQQTLDVNTDKPVAGNINSKK